MYREDILNDVALSLVGLSADTVLYLVECFGSAEAVFEATPEELLHKAELTKKNAMKLLTSMAREHARAEMTFAEKYKLRVLVYGHDDYPQNLMSCNDAPYVLYVKGNIDFNENSSNWVSVVGTRKNSIEGLRLTEQIVSDLADDYPETVIVGGLAYGVDSIAHRKALLRGLKTVAVVAHGLDTLYPSDHRGLAKQIIEDGGAIVTEFPSQTTAMRYNFLKRNRIIAGISPATVVVESPVRGGSMNTANIAESYGREIFTPPGRLSDDSFSGNIKLIKSNKANMYVSVNDMSYIMNWERREPEIKFNLILSDEEQAIYDCFDRPGEITVDEIIERTEMPASLVLGLLTGLEMKDIVMSVKGGMYVKRK